MNRLILFSLISFSSLAQQVSPPVVITEEDIIRHDDKNHDGKLSPDEMPEGPRKNFARIDRNHDGFVDLEELKAARANGGRGRPQGPPGAPARAQQGSAAQFATDIDARRDIPYAGTDNKRQMLDLYLPKKRATDKPLPVIVFIHGGGWKGGDRASGAGNVSRFVASGDYAGASIGYRLTDEAQWPAQIFDCKAAIRWLRGNAKEFNLDPDKIAVWGSSAGGHLVSMLGTSGGVKELEGSLGSFTSSSSRVTCVVNFFGPEDFITMVTKPSTIDRTTPDYPEALLIGGRVQDMPERARAASPITYVSGDDPPFLTAHGTKDPLVPYDQALELDAAMEKAGVSHLLIEMTNGGHGFRSPDLDLRVKQFFDLHLRGAEGEIPTTPIAVEARR
ncbi:MAG: alpha/beta hydrolase fold domain-containing protein [Verrucomicrobiaceae bacterium]|nr:alpha/beta hydrolase fold domain-containing protein [Verrucomicrobiaceae bacterium]